MRPVQEYDIIPLSFQKQDTAIQYQDIEYCLSNRGKSVYCSEHRKIDFQNALHETKNLDWTYLDNGISLVNNKTSDCIFFRRVDLDKWYVDTPIRIPRFAGLFWASYIDESIVESILRLFFDECDWFSVIHWFEAPDLFEEINDSKFARLEK